MPGTNKTNTAPEAAPATKYAAGMAGQNHAEAFLTAKGYKITHRNWRVRTGEIDLVARQGTYIVFIEVKSRTTTSHGTGREAVTSAKQRSIIRTAAHFCTRYRLHDCDIRFDVVEVMLDGDEIHIEHIENAFWA